MNEEELELYLPGLTELAREGEGGDTSAGVRCGPGTAGYLSPAAAAKGLLTSGQRHHGAKFGGCS